MSTKKTTTQTNRKKDHLTVVLEDMNYKFDIMIEGQQILTERVGRIEQKLSDHDKRFDQLDYRMDKIEHRMDNMEHRMDNMEHRMDNMEHRMDNMENRMDNMEHQMDNIKTEMHQGFRMSFEHMNRIENEITGELAKKADKEDVKKLSRRVERLEKASI